MAEGPLPEAEGEIGAGVLSLFLGFPVALLFNTFIQGQDLVVVLLTLVGFGDVSSMVKSTWRCRVAWPLVLGCS
jgi:hypothetical protein